MTARYSPDFTRVATAGFDGTSRVYDAQSGELIRAVGDMIRVSWVDFAPDGGSIVTSSYDSTANIWDLTLGGVDDRLSTSIGSIAAVPNPSSGAVAVRFHLERPATVRLELVTALGEAASAPIDATLDAGDHSLRVATETLAPGLYVARLSTRDGARSVPVTIVR